MTTVYFGLPGQPLKLWDPTGGILATRDVGTATFITGNGGARVNKAYGGNRTYALNYGALGRDSFEDLNRYQQGHMGPGPFVLMESGRRNLLGVNQSSGTSASNDTREFTVSGPGGSLSSDASLSTPFPKTLRWSWSTTSPASALLTLDKPSRLTSWYGIPVIPGQSYCFWFVVVGGPVELTATITWYNLTGGVVSTSTASVTTDTANWKKPYAVGVCPPGAAWALCTIPATTGTIANGEAVNISSLMFHTGDQPERWQPGTGVYPVQVMSMPEKYMFGTSSMLVAPTLILQEVK